MIDFANYWGREGYHTIWVDLESVHTLAGVVGSIIDQCRSYDASLPPIVLPLEEGIEPEDAPERRAWRDIAKERVVHALRRTRYLVVIDGLETYVWPATAHHGLTNRWADEAALRMHNLCMFLNELAERRETIGESFVCAGVDDFKSRRQDRVLADKIRSDERVDILLAEPFPWEKVKPCTDKDMLQFTEHLMPGTENGAVPLLRVSDLALRSTVRAARTDLAPSSDAIDQVVSLVIFLLSCFRRPRTLVALRSILGPLLGTSAAVDRVLAVLARENSWAGMVRLEGGAYWFSRVVRDYVYEKCSDCTSKERMAACLAQQCDEDLRRRAAFQLFVLASAHQRIAHLLHGNIRSITRY